jgi:Rps23 Pro-64 3,4-dihydroxylase Tpa1-like proline 4-hydroxylase
MDFVYEVENNLPASLCEEIIKRYKDDDRKVESAIGDGGTINKSVRSSKILPITDDKKWKDIDDILAKKLSEGIKEYHSYLEKYTIKRIADAALSHVNDEGYAIQEMKVGDFYDWHSDNGLYSRDRQVTCIWYLNTLDEDQGGCTEFWGGKRVRPKQGTLLFFPSTWSYIHRGAPVKNSAVKYTCITWLSKPDLKI